MPSRKSDARRSDVSVARFVLADDDSAMATESPAPEPAPLATAAEEPSVAGSTPGPQQPSSDKKDKDKERDRERERDNLTIEVCMSSITQSHAGGRKTDRVPVSC